MDNGVLAQQEQQLQGQHLALTIMSILSITFWNIIWIMHLCALTNAKIKFKKSNSQCNNRTKSRHSNKHKYFQSNPHHHFFYEQTQEHKLFDHPQQEELDGHQCHDQVLSITSNKQQNNLLCNVLSSCPLPATISSRGHMGEVLNQGNDNNNNNKINMNINIHNIHNNNIHNNNSNILVNLEDDANIIIASGAIHDELHLDANNLKNNLTKHSNNDKHRSRTHPILINETAINKNINLHHSMYISLPLPDYPTYEILFCVQESCDAAILVVEELFKKYPNADARLFVGGARVGVNPKINNMQPAYEHMKHELILISDSGISMLSDTLTDMVGHMTEEVALVHQMPFVYCHGRDNFQSIVERVYFGTAHARAYLTADLLNINCPTGMSALMRKCLLDEVGGIKAFGHYLAEDFFFAKSFTERGWKVRISSQPALQNSANSSDTLGTFNSRIQRWIKLRFAMVPLITLLEPFSECMLLGLLGALSMSFLWAFNPFLVFSLHIILWFTFDYHLLCTIQNGPPTCRKRDYLAAWLIRECTALVVFMTAVTDPKVNWRSRQFKIKWGGYTEEVSSFNKTDYKLDCHDQTTPNITRVEFPFKKK